MKISKKAILLLSVYAAAIFLVLGGFIYKEHTVIEKYERNVAATYNHAFAELTSCLDEIENSLNRSLYATSPSMISFVCADIYAQVRSAQLAMSSLPFSNIELEHTAAFISKTGDYVSYIARNASKDDGYSDEEYKNLLTLSESAASVADTLDALQSRLIAGQLSISELERTEEELSSEEDALVDTSFAGSVKQMETEFPEIPSLIYDGPFSAHIESMTPKLLEGTSEISEDEAVETAAEFSNISADRWKFEYIREDSIPVYVLSSNTNNTYITCEVTKSGGKILYFGNNRYVQNRTISPEDCVKIAAKFLAEKGISSMKDTYWTVVDNKVTVNFAYSHDDVIYYPDLIKVTVAMDTGSIVTYESHGYIMCHTERELKETKISQEDAKEKISPHLAVLSSSSCVIPTSGKNEILCHEFKCEDEKGRHCLVYVNAETGNEEKILILLEDENGTLTI